MATFKFIEPSAAAITEMQLSLNDIDYFAQSAQQKIEAAARSICLMLREPDSGAMRVRIKTLCTLIEDKSFDVMNTVNSIAERHGANYIDEQARAEDSRICAAALAGAASAKAGQEVTHV